MKKKITLITGSFLIVAAFSFCTFTQKNVTVEVSNPLKTDRTNEMIEVDYHTIVKKLGNVEMVVKDASGKQIAYQITYENKLIFPATVSASSKSTYTVRQGTPEQFKQMASGRFVPERKDDYAWENNLVAHRIYGPALQATGEISNGVDVWSKRTDELIIDLWYHRAEHENLDYHSDRGEGADIYKVGRTLGGGIAAPFVKDTLWLGYNFISYETLENGPLRVTFRLKYAPYNVDGIEVSETRVISLDAYSRFNKMTQIVEGDFTTMPMAVSLVKHPGEEHFFDTKQGVISVYEPGDTQEENVYNCVAIIAQNTEKMLDGCGHFMAIVPYKAGTDLVYYFGSAWSKAGFNQAYWNEYVLQKATELETPLKVALK